MDDVPRRLAHWWSGLDDGARRHASALAVISVGFVGHYLVYTLPQPFFIEDAGISFAFARNLVEGDGLVGYPGGERVEGYSNFLWTMLVAGLYALGVPPWTSAKLMGALFGVITLPLVYRIVRKARPNGDGKAALLAAAMLAASPQFVIWAAAGLENSLVCVLMAAGMDSLLREMNDETAHRIPRSAVWFALLAMTRPEGLAYGGIAGFALFLDCVARRRIQPLVVWGITLVVPILVYQGWRYWYFAWEFPNTYYAKLGIGTRFKPWNWTGGGWKYIKRYFTNHHLGFALPLFAVATVGLNGWRRWLGLTITLWVGLLLAWDGREGLDSLGLDPMPELWREVTAKWVKIRVWSIAGAIAVFGVGLLGRPGWRARGLLWCVAVFAGFFALYAGGDWMSQHRWFNMVVMGMIPMLALGVADLLDGLGVHKQVLKVPESVTGAPAFLRRGIPWRSGLLMAALGLWLIPEVSNANTFANNPETSVRDIMRRVRYMSWVQRRLDIDHVVLLDVDMGAHMYYSGWEIVDIAGLIDVSMARHSNFDMKFIRNYLFEERNPDFAHVHGGWAKTSKIPRHREWKSRYIEIPGYPIGRSRLHVGNHIRRDLFITKSDDRIPVEAPRFDGRVRLLKFEVPSPEVAAGTRVFFDTEWAASLRDNDFRILAFLYDESGVVSSVMLPPGYGWVKADEWKTSDRVAGRYRYLLPEDLPAGEYKLGVVLLDEESGAVLKWRNQGDPSTEAPRYMDGEWLSDEVIRVVARPEARAAAEQDLDAALAFAVADDCDNVWPSWKNARRHVDDRTRWIEDNDRVVRRALASCIVRQSDAADDLQGQAAGLKEARRWDRTNPDLLERQQVVADACEASGDAAYAEEDWETAYRDYTLALGVDPFRSWTRRRAEDARDYWLRIVRPGRTKEDLPDRRGVRADDEKGAAKGADPKNDQK